MEGNKWAGAEGSTAGSQREYLRVKQGFLHNITHTLTLLECHVYDLSKFASLWRWKVGVTFTHYVINIDLYQTQSALIPLSIVHFKKKKITKALNTFVLLSMMQNVLF